MTKGWRLLTLTYSATTNLFKSKSSTIILASKESKSIKTRLIPNKNWYPITNCCTNLLFKWLMHFTLYQIGHIYYGNARSLQPLDYYTYQSAPGDALLLPRKDSNMKLTMTKSLSEKSFWNFLDWTLILNFYYFYCTRYPTGL